jgi:hypothetical protein
MKASQAVLAASVAGLMAAIGAMSTGQTVQAAESDKGDKVPCYGVNKCKAMGACGGKDHSCAGLNTCAGHGYLEIDKETCLKIKDGRLTPEPEKAADKAS